MNSFFYFIQDTIRAKSVEVIPHISTLERYAERAKDMLFVYGTRIAFALITLVIGFYLISLVVRALKRVMQARDVDATLRPFLSAIASIALKIMLLLTVASMAGIQTTSFMAALGAAGLAIGLALQGSLSNFAGGVLILLFKPFRVGDYIAAQGQEGTVQEINILYTTLTTPDNKKVVIPNGVLSNNDIVNFTAFDMRRIDMRFMLGNTANFAMARDIIFNLAMQHPLSIKDPAAVVGVSEMRENGITMICNVWVERVNFFAVKHDLYERIVAALVQNAVIATPRPVEEMIAAGFNASQPKP